MGKGGEKTGERDGGGRGVGKSEAEKGRGNIKGKKEENRGNGRGREEGVRKRDQGRAGGRSNWSRCWYM